MQALFPNLQKKVNLLLFDRLQKKWACRALLILNHLHNLASLLYNARHSLNNWKIGQYQVQLLWHNDPNLLIQVEIDSDKACHEIPKTFLDHSRTDSPLPLSRRADEFPQLENV